MNQMFQQTRECLLGIDDLWTFHTSFKCSAAWDICTFGMWGRVWCRIAAPFVNGARVSCIWRAPVILRASSQRSYTQDALVDLAHRIEQSDRLALSKGITLIESVNQEHQKQAATLLDLVLEANRKRAALRVRQLHQQQHGSADGNNSQSDLVDKSVDDVLDTPYASKREPLSFRIGFSGPPGVGT